MKSCWDTKSLLPTTVQCRTSKFWKIGHFLYGASWRAQFEQRFDRGFRTIGLRPPTFLSKVQREELQDEYRRLQKFSPKAREVLKIIRVAGPEGTNITHQRVADLRQAGLIFDSGRRGGMQGQAVIWVVIEYKNHYLHM